MKHMLCRPAAPPVPPRRREKAEAATQAGPADAQPEPEPEAPKTDFAGAARERRGCQGV